jgi:hypothetical protein
MAVNHPADAAMNVNVRKVAGLQQLHELALLKELQAEPWPLSLAPALAVKKHPSRHWGTFKAISRTTRHVQNWWQHMHRLNLSI